MNLMRKYAIYYLKTIEKSPIDLFISLPTTSPLRKPNLDKCFQEYIDFNPDLVITVSPAQRHPSFNIVKLDGDGYAQIFHENNGFDTAGKVLKMHLTLLQLVMLQTQTL